MHPLLDRLSRHNWWKISFFLLLLLLVSYIASTNLLWYRQQTLGMIQILNYNMSLGMIKPVPPPSAPETASPTPATQPSRTSGPPSTAASPSPPSSASPSDAPSTPQPPAARSSGKH